MNPNNAIITVEDDGHLVMNRVNTPIDLNADGTANLVWVNVFSKYHAFANRLKRVDITEDDLL